MNEEHVITSYQAWEEERLDTEERRVIQRHLQDCESCGDYYEKMSALLDTTNPSLLPHLEADPFLPTRVRAIVDAGVPVTGTGVPAASRDALTGEHVPAGRAAKAPAASYGRAAAWLRVSVAGAMTVTAIVTGVYLGRGLAKTQSTNGDAEIVTAYYEAVAQTEFAGDWGDVIEEKEEEQR